MIWQANTNYQHGDVVECAGHVLRCVIPGTSGETEPSINAQIQLSDGSVVWRVIGLV